MSAMTITTNEISPLSATLRAPRSSFSRPYGSPPSKIRRIEVPRPQEHISLQGSTAQVVEQAFFGLLFGGFAVMAASFVTSFLL